MTTKTITGVVTKINAKAWPDPRSGADVILYSFTVDGERGWFRTGTTRPSFKEGNAVRFVVDTRKGNVDMGSIELLEDTEVTRAPSVSSASEKSFQKFPPRSNAGNTRDDYWKDKDKYYKEVEVPRITYSACQSRAIEVVKLGLAHEAINLGAAKNKRLDNLLAVIDEVTNTFINQINSLGADGRPQTGEQAEGAPFDDEINFGPDKAAHADGWNDYD